MRTFASSGSLGCLLLSGLLWAAEGVDDFSGMRGANYVPSYARNDVQIWMDYDPAVIDRELGYAERLRLNTVRVFLQFAVYERDPQLFLERFENFLSLCDKHHIRMMPVVFDSCFGEFPDLENYAQKDWMACPGQNRLGQEHWPQLESYVRDIVGKHRDDPRIIMWDVMNEPTCTSFNTPADKELIWTFLRHMLDFVRELDTLPPADSGSREHEPDSSGTGQDRRGVHSQLSAGSARRSAGGQGTGSPTRQAGDHQRGCGPTATTVFHVMPILAEEKVGWCFWELMIGRTQFSQGPTPYQGVIYPDGTCFDATEVMLIASRGQQALPPRAGGPRAGFATAALVGRRGLGLVPEPAVAGGDQLSAQYSLQHHGVLASRELRRINHPTGTRHRPSHGLQYRASVPAVPGLEAGSGEIQATVCPVSGDCTATQHLGHADVV